MAHTKDFENERPRLTRIASSLLDDAHEAEDIVQKAWMRLHQSQSTVENAAAWLTTVTTRLCLDRLKARVPIAAVAIDEPSATADPAAAVERAESIGQALNVVLDRLQPTERVAFVLHDSFGFDFQEIGVILNRTPAAARKLASRARLKIADANGERSMPDWQVVDAFMAAARGGDFARLLELLAPDVVVSADAAAITNGTPERIAGRQAVAEFFDGSATAALPIFLDGRPGAAWFQRGRAMVAFDFSVTDGRVVGIVFRAAADVLTAIARRDGGVVRVPVTFGAAGSSYE